MRPILLVIGLLSAILGVTMMLPAIIDAALGHEEWKSFFIASIITTLFGLGLWLAMRGTVRGLGVRQAFLMTVSAWVALTLFGSLPLYLSGVVPHFVDAVFESMSGITTTGATVIVDLDNTAPGALFWRAILQWLGGLGIIVMAVAVLPMLQIGGMQIFKAEAFDTSDAILPRVTQISGAMTLIYIALTIACSFAYFSAGMSFYDAIYHAMTTVATGGFSSKNASMGHFDSALIDSICIAFMIAGSLPFMLWLQVLQGRIKPILTDEQVRAFFMLLGTFIMAIWAYETLRGVHFGIEGLRYAAFNVVSVMTGTGYANDDYGAWGSFSVAVFFAITFIGGCAGSTSCGLKVFRVQVLFMDMRQHLNKLAFPNGVFVRRYNNQPLPSSVSLAVMAFFFLFMLSFLVLSILLAATGLDTITALSGAATALSNVGPGLGEIIGPSGNFSTLNDTAKWLLIVGMLVGRLEFFTILVLVLPRFWRS
ncbi:MAG: potassium transporter TrkH [Hyphomicrobiales bacterium]|nr:MAG: potassium transporter TrkH [Hyphomicrobiales bacterium]